MAVQVALQGQLQSEAVAQHGLAAAAVVAGKALEQRPAALAQAALLVGQGPPRRPRQLVPEPEQVLGQLAQLLTGGLGGLAGAGVQGRAGRVELAVGGVAAPAAQLVEVGVLLLQLAAGQGRYSRAQAEKGSLKPG